MKPILFNTDMVRAILDGRKTVTRRVVKFKAGQNPKWTGYIPDGPVLYGSNNIPAAKAPYKPGEILYVRETWAPHKTLDGTWYGYKADGDYRDVDLLWRPSIHMPKEAARIFLLVKSVRAERLQEITEEQAVREGIVRMFDHLTDEEYKQWSSRTAPDKKKSDWGWNNYLWHGDFGAYGMGNRLSDAWPYQMSGYEDPRGSFSSLWNLTVELKDWPTYGWEANPLVWVIEFERCERPEEV